MSDLTLLSAIQLRSRRIPPRPLHVITVNHRATARHLDLEAPRASPATSPLEFSPLALDVRFLHRELTSRTIVRRSNPTRTFPLCGPNPKCLTASRAFFGPLNNNVLLPVGALNANWSIVRHSPPAFSILARAVAVNR